VGEIDAYDKIVIENHLFINNSVRGLLFWGTLYIFKCSITCLSAAENKLALHWTKQLASVISGAGTKLKVGGHTSDTKRRKKNFCRAPSSFLALHVQLVVFVSAIVFSTVWSGSLLFFYSQCPRVSIHL